MPSNLIGHDHDLSIAQSLEGFWVTVVLLVLKAKDLNDVVDFSILHYLKRTMFFHPTGMHKTIPYVDEDP